jgi:hypothetical protein
VAQALYCRECGAKMQTLAGGDVMPCCEVGKDREEFYGDADMLLPGPEGKQFAAPVPALPFDKLPKDTQFAIGVLADMGGVGAEWEFWCKLPWLTPRIAAACGNSLAFRREGLQAKDGSIRYRVMLTENAMDACRAWRRAQPKGDRK